MRGSTHPGQAAKAFSVSLAEGKKQRKVDLLSESAIKLCINPFTQLPHKGTDCILPHLGVGKGIQLNVPSVKHMPKAYILFKF